MKKAKTVEWLTEAEQTDLMAFSYKVFSNVSIPSGSRISKKDIKLSLDIYPPGGFTEISLKKFLSGPHSSSKQIDLCIFYDSFLTGILNKKRLCVCFQFRREKLLNDFCARYKRMVLRPLKSVTSSDCEEKTISGAHGNKRWVLKQNKDKVLWRDINSEYPLLEPNAKDGTWYFSKYFEPTNPLKYRSDIQRLEKECIDFFNNIISESSLFAEAIPKRRRIAKSEPNSNKDEQLYRDLQELMNDAEIPETRQKQLISARIGQGKFRTAVANYWKHMCALSGCTNFDLLIASHIKPWAECNNSDKLDPFNGILLSPNYDRLFDRGYISFKDNGELIVSKQLSIDSIAALKIEKNQHVKFHKRHIPFLKFHRTKCLKK